MNKGIHTSPTQSAEEMAFIILSYLEDDPRDDKVPHFNEEEDLYNNTLYSLHKDKFITSKLIDEKGSTSYYKSSIMVYRITSGGREYLSKLREKYKNA